MSGLGSRFALLLHPAAYRRERGEELAMVFADTTAGAGRWTTARELVDLAGHGVRLRIGLGSDRLPAQLAALAAPFAATAAVAGALVTQLGYLAQAQRFGELGQALWPTRSTDVWLTYHWLGQAGLLLLLAAAVAAVFGRWTTARLTALAGLLPTLTGEMVELTHSTSWDEGQLARLTARAVVWYGPQALWVLILLAAPRDLLGPATRRRTFSALAGVLVSGFLLNAALRLGPAMSLDVGATGSMVLALVLGATELALLTAAVPALLRGRYGPAAAALAGSPVAFLMLFTAICHLWNSGGHGSAAALLGAAVVIAAALGRWLPTIPDRQPPTAD